MTARVRSGVRWAKTYGTVDDFVADTGTVVREQLTAEGQATYDEVRAEIAKRLPHDAPRETEIKLTGRTSGAIALVIKQPGLPVIAAVITTGDDE